MGRGREKGTGEGQGRERRRIFSLNSKIPATKEQNLTLHKLPPFFKELAEQVLGP